MSVLGQRLLDRGVAPLAVGAEVGRDVDPGRADLRAASGTRRTGSPSDHRAAGVPSSRSWASRARREAAR